MAASAFAIGALIGENNKSDTVTLGHTKFGVRLPEHSDTSYVISIPIDSCAWQNPVHKFRDGPPEITIHQDTATRPYASLLRGKDGLPISVTTYIIDTTDLGLINALRTKPLYNRWTFHTVDQDSLVMHSWFFDSGYQVFIQIAGHMPDTTVFVRYKKAAVCVTPAVEALVKRKLLKP